VGYVDGDPGKHASLRIVSASDGTRLELHVLDVPVARLERVSDVAPEPWVTAAGVALGVRVSLRTADGTRRRAHIRFGTPGGTL
jgi:hypothetical protein